jgi:hypothetical protein
MLEATVIAQTNTTVTLALPTAPLAGAFIGRTLATIGASNYDALGALGGRVITASSAAANCVLTISNIPHQFQIGSLVLMTTLSTTNTATSIGDSHMVNPVYPSGMTVNAEIGNVVRITYDPTGAAWGATATVVSNTSTVLTTTQFLSYAGLPVTPGAGCIFFVEEPTWRVDVVTTAALNTALPNLTNPSTQAVAKIPFAPLQGLAALVEVLLQDADGNDSDESTDAIKLIYVSPSAQASSAGYFSLTAVAGVVTIDVANGLIQRYQIPTPATAISFADPIFTGGTIAAGVSVDIWLDTPASTNFETPTFDTGAGGFASDTAARYTASPGVSLRDKLTFDFHPEGVWGLDGDPRKGGSIT